MFCAKQECCFLSLFIDRTKYISINFVCFPKEKKKSRKSAVCLNLIFKNNIYFLQGGVNVFVKIFRVHLFVHAMLKQKTST